MSMLTGIIPVPPAPGTNPVMAWNGTRFAPTDSPSLSSLTLSGALSAASAVITGALVLGSLELGSALGLASGGTAADLSATGGANQIVRQNSLGGAFTVSVLAAADIPSSLNATTFASVTNSSLTATRVCYAGVSGLMSDDSAFTRASLALSVDSGADTTVTLGYGKFGFPTSGTAGQFCMGLGSTFTSTSYGIKFVSAAGTRINAGTGMNIIHRINEVDKFTLSATAATFASGTPVTISDNTASTTTTTGALIVSGGVGVAGTVTAAALSSSGNVLQAGAFSFASNGTKTNVLTSGYVGFWRSGGTIGTTGDLVFQTDSSVTNAAYVFRAGPTTPITVATLSGAAVAGTTPALATVGTSTITGGVTDGYNGSLRLASTYDAASALTVTRHNYIDIPNVALTGAGPAALTDACVFRYNAAVGTHKALDAATTKTTPGGVDGWEKKNVNGTIMFSPLYLSKTA